MLVFKVNSVHSLFISVALE